MRSALILTLALAALGACADKPPINSFCAWWVPPDLADPGIYGLNATNKRALIVNRNTADRECRDTKPGGSR